jgi:hypothetical protein
LVGIVILVYNIPGPLPVGDYVFIPLRFVVAWVAGYALRERAEQAEAAEERAVHAERERESAARVAVAEERSRIARELHDIVAHAVSVMVLHVGAVRHKLPATMAEDRDALKGVERAGRRSPRAPSPRCYAPRRRTRLRLVLSSGLDGLDSPLQTSAAPACPSSCMSTASPSAAARSRPLPIASFKKALRTPRTRATDADVTVRYRPDELRSRFVTTAAAA